MLLIEEGITFRGPRLHMFVLFHRRGKRATAFCSQVSALLPAPVADTHDDVAAHYDAVVSQWREKEKGNGPLSSVKGRLVLTWAAVLKQMSSDVSFLPEGACEFLCKVFVLHSILLHYRPPSHRSFSLPPARLNPVGRLSSTFFDAIYQPLYQLVRVARMKELGDNDAEAKVFI